ncbi:MAG: hypothetical protein AB1656_25085 [Candidatus Omnitrophota bacterium]
MRLAARIVWFAWAAAFFGQIIAVEKSWAKSSIDFSQEENRKSVRITNYRIAAEIDYDEAVKISEFSAGMDTFLYPDEKNSTAGCSLILFADNPHSSTQEIELPHRYRAIRSATDEKSDAAVGIESLDAGQVSLRKVFSIKDEISTLHIDTCIKNESERILTFYPAEAISFFVGTVKPNYSGRIVSPTDLYFYAPYDKMNAVTITQGPKTNKEFIQVEKDSLFIAHYERENGAVKLTSSKGWIAAQNGQNYRVTAIEFSYKNQNIEPIEYNLQVRTESLEDNGSPVQAQVVLGKVTLKPGETFEYASDWSNSASGIPIIEVKDGAAYNKTLEALTTDAGFYIFAIMGIPQDGYLGVEFLDEKDQIVKRHDYLSLILDVTLPRPSSAVSKIPTILTHEIGFPFDEKSFKNGQYLIELQNQIKKIRLIMMDDKKNILRVIDEVKAPWKKLDETSSKP